MAPENCNYRFHELYPVFIFQFLSSCDYLNQYFLENEMSLRSLICLVYIKHLIVKTELVHPISLKNKILRFKV